MTSKAEQVRGSRKRKRTLGLDAIVDVALAIIDSEGTDAVSMRRVAAEFDTGPASLYAYVRNKQELFEQVLDRITTEAVIPEDADTWQEMVRGWAHNGRAMFRAHQDAAKLAFAHVSLSEASIGAAEKVMGAMIEGGVPPQVAAWALDIVSLYINADAYEGWLTAQREAGAVDDELAVAGQQLTDLPADRFPYMAQYAPLLLAGASDERFAFGIDMLIAGFEAQIPVSRDH